MWRGCIRRIGRWNGQRGVQYGRDGNRYGCIIRWDYTVSYIILGTEHNAPLAFAPGLELHHSIISMLGEHRDRLEIERGFI